LLIGYSLVNAYMYQL